MSVNPDFRAPLSQKELDYFNKLAARHHVGVAKPTYAPADESDSSGRYRHRPSSCGGGGSLAFASASASSGDVGLGRGVNLSTLRAINTDKRDGAAAAVFGLAMFGLGALLAYVTTDYSEKSEYLKKAKDIKETLIEENRWVSRKKDIVNADIEFAEKELSKSREIVFVTATLLATAAVGFTAGMLGVSWLVTASIIVSVFTLAIGAFLGVRRCIEKKNVLPDYVLTGLKDIIAENNQTNSGTERYSEAI